MRKKCKKVQNPPQKGGQELQNGTKMITFCTKVVKKMQKNYKNEH
jgi:hypothetical protein